MTVKTTYRKNKYGVVRINVRDYKPINYQNIASTLKFKYGKGTPFNVVLQPTPGIQRIFQKMENCFDENKNIYLAGCCAEFVGYGWITCDGERVKTYDYRFNNDTVSMNKGTQPFEAYLYGMMLDQGIKNAINH